MAVLKKFVSRAYATGVQVRDAMALIVDGIDPEDVNQRGVDLALRRAG